MRRSTRAPVRMPPSRDTTLTGGKGGLRRASASSRSWKAKTAATGASTSTDRTITVASDGTVSATQPGQATASRLGQIQLAIFPNPGGLNATGHNLFEPTSASGAAQVGNPASEGRGSLLQGALEGSNVEIVDEMIGLIRAQRAYEVNSKVISAADEMLRNATQAR